MDAEAKNMEQPVEEAVKNLKVDASTKASNVNLSSSKDASSSDATSCVSSGDVANSIKEGEVNQEASTGDQGMYHYGYYYPGFNGSLGGWDDNGYFVGTNGLEIHPAVVQADNGSYLCYVPGFENGYASYSPFMPGAMIGVDGQYVGEQAFYPSPVLSQHINSLGVFAQPVAYGSELAPAYTWDSPFVMLDGFQGNTIHIDPKNSSQRPKYLSNKHAVLSSKVSRSSKSTSDMKGSSLALDMSTTSCDNQPSKPANKASGAALTKGYLTTSKSSVHANQGKGTLLYPNKGVNLKENGRSWNCGEKLKVRSKLHGFGDYNSLNENNHPNNSTNSWTSRVDPIGSLSTIKNDGGISPPAAVSKDGYSRPDFVTKYEQALFFVIKSYSEDDVHKSIKYNVWASTPNGNKRLDNAFKVAQEKMTEKGTKCPVFLFFSVNASGQFCGVAEMAGPVDFNRNMDFWQQDKWNGFFPVKWHMIKDVPNPQFRHIILENNENKPVTNSRDTQEVKFPQGIEMLNIFKNYSSKTSILDDFEFYENRQRVMQDRRSKPPATASEHPVPKTDEPADVSKETEFSSTLPSVELDTNNNNEGQHADVAKDG